MVQIYFLANKYIFCRLLLKDRLLMKLDSIRREYKFAELTRKNVDKDPLKQLQIWISEALNTNTNEATAMSVVTTDIDGFPEVRIVLLKKLDKNGILFFTDYSSSKGKAIKKNNKVGLHFFWPIMERQVRISGYAVKTSEEISDNYFNSRPITSQIAAVVSNQSKEIPSREFLENHFFDLQNQLHGKAPKRPETWGGYLVKPLKMEFWQGRESRLHDRIVYEIKNKKWQTKRLAP